MENEGHRSATRQEPVREDVTEETRRRAGETKTQAAGSTPPGAPVRRDLRRALSSRHALREAILLHEILGPPKGMEQPAR